MSDQDHKPQFPAHPPKSKFPKFLILISIPFLLTAYLVQNGTQCTDDLLPPSIAAPIRTLVSKLRILTALDCQLGNICTPDQARPLLPDGRPSHQIWDLPRNLMESSFAKIKQHLPDVTINYMWEEPLVVYFDNVLTEDEIDLILNTAETRFSKSMVVGADGEAVPDDSRTSDTAWIYISEDEKFRNIVSKVANLAGFTVEQAEHIGVNRYKSAQYFNPHFDFLDEASLASYEEFPSCQRASTTLIYLSDVEQGGESVFIRKGHMDGSFDYDHNNPDHLVVKPKRGRVLVWYDMHPYTEQVDRRTLHGGSPVKQGVKTAATIFIRNCTRSLLFDAPEPAAAPVPPADDLPHHEDL